MTRLAQAKVTLNFSAVAPFVLHDQNVEALTYGRMQDDYINSSIVLS